MLDEKDLQAISQLIKTELTPINVRLDKMDGRMDQMQEDISNLRTTVTRVAVTQENIVLPQLKLLAEGHETLLNTLARKDRVEALEADVSLLKTALQAMSLQIAELQKAQ